MTIKQRISTCLWYNDDGEEAANFYVSLFPNSRIISVMRYGEGQPLPKGTAMLTRFELDGTEFAALNGGAHFKLTEAASLVALCETQAEIDRLWTRLTANGGAESQCGWLKDRFGLSWQIIPEGVDNLMADPVKGARVFQALMPMRKIDIEKLQQAFNQ
jgi:predicted 3-demethylubiquinone-9 3-methyltransferase (glyoxalase superfamily)